MAWLVSTLPVSKWTVGTVTTPPEVEVFEEREKFRRDNPGLFPSLAGIDRQGVHLPRHLFPESARISSTSTKNPPDFVTIMGMGVSEKIRDIIEKMEPERHQFIEVPVSLKNGKPAPKRYFAVSIGNWANNQVVSKLTTVPRGPNGTIEQPRRDQRGIVTIDRSATKDWHMWASEDFLCSMTISNQLKLKFISSMIEGLEYTRIYETELKNHENENI